MVHVQKSGCFVYICGRTPILNFFGGRGGRSIGQTVHIHLSLFKTSDLKDILWYPPKETSTDSTLEIKTNGETTLVGACLKITTKEEAQHIAEWLYNITTGVPHYVEYVLIEMINQTNQANSLINWNESHEDSMLEMLLQKVQNFIPKFNFSNNPDSQKRKKDIETLTHLALMNEKLNGGSMIDRHDVTDLIQFYGFYVETVENDRNIFTIKIPRLWIYANIFHETSLNTLFNPIDTSSALESYVQQVLVLRSTSIDREVPLVKDRIPFLSKTLVGNEFFTRIEIGEMKIRENKKNQMEIFGSEVDISTSLPDLIAMLPITENGRYLIGWQMKNYTSTKLGTPEIKEEIEKFSDILLNRSCKGGVFVIVLNGQVMKILKRIEEWLFR